MLTFLAKISSTCLVRPTVMTNRWSQKRGGLHGMTRVPCRGTSVPALKDQSISQASSKSKDLVGDNARRSVKIKHAFSIVSTVKLSLTDKPEVLQETPLKILRAIPPRLSAPSPVIVVHPIIFSILFGLSFFGLSRASLLYFSWTTSFYHHPCFIAITSEDTPLGEPTLGEPIVGELDNQHFPVPSRRLITGQSFLGEFVLILGFNCLTVKRVTARRPWTCNTHVLPIYLSKDLPYLWFLLMLRLSLSRQTRYTIPTTLSYIFVPRTANTWGR